MFFSLFVLLILTFLLTFCQLFSYSVIVLLYHSNRTTKPNQIKVNNSLPIEQKECY